MTHHIEKKITFQTINTTNTTKLFFFGQQFILLYKIKLIDIYYEMILDRKKICS